MAKITDDNGNLIDAGDVEVCMKESELNRIFDLAVKIDQIEVAYDSDSLAMANDAISTMRKYASEIAATVGYRLP